MAKLVFGDLALGSINTFGANCMLRYMSYGLS